MITSLTSPKIVRVRRLLETHSPSERESLGEFVVEGLRAVTAILDHSRSQVIELFASEKWIADFPEATLISDEVAARVSDTVSPQGIFATVKIPSSGIDLKVRNNVAIFVELQDPGNAGTVIRSAHAFGVDALVLAKGSVDPYSSKVVRASVGSLLSTPLVIGADLEVTIDSLRSTHQLLAFDMDGIDIRRFEKVGPVAMIFGNEARGLPESIINDGSVTRVKIPMVGTVESLNVASAATIAMFEISQPANE